MAASRRQIEISEPGLAGSYELVEQRADGSLVLRPSAERLSDVLRGTQVLRVKRVQGSDGVWEITFAPDGRATFAYGPEILPGEPPVIWRRVGTRDVLSDA